MTDEHAPNASDEHALPPPAIPAAELSRYKVTSDPDSEQDIARYVEIETRGEVVEHVELVTKANVVGTVYSVWDVVTDRDRYWVVSDLTNLYSQQRFPSLDFTLSFHVGLMMRLHGRQSGVDSNDPSPFDEVIRRFDQAREMRDRAVESEESQAVAAQLREGLLALLPAMRRRLPTIANDPELKDADFKGWYARVADALCPGSTNAPLRTFLKHTSKETWDFVAWLVHYKEADKTAATIALESCFALLGHTMQAIERASAAFADRCPSCRSRNIRSHFDPFLGADGEYYFTCGVCGWSSHPGEADEADASEL